MPGIDYSKWDKLNLSSSSDSNRDEDEQGTGSSGVPQVTRLSYPSRVVVGPNGVQLEQRPSKASATPFTSAGGQPAHSTALVTNPAQSSPDLLAVGISRVGESGQLKANEKPKAPHASTSADATDDDDEDLHYESLARNGGREGAEYWWSQTEDTATVSFLIPWEATTKCITEFRLHEVPISKEGSNHAHVDITICLPAAKSSVPSVTDGAASAEPTVLHLRKEFRYPIKLTEELTEGCWQMYRMPQRHLRLLVVQVFKEPIGVGMTLWWDRCFLTDLKAIIDTQTIPDRVNRAGRGVEDKAAQFRQVWAEAHEEFRRRMQERKERSV